MSARSLVHLPLPLPRRIDGATRIADLIASTAAPRQGMSCQRPKVVAAQTGQNRAEG